MPASAPGRMRLSDRDRRILRFAIAFVVVFTVVAAVIRLAWPGPNGHGGDLWLFGFDTIRVDIDHPSSRHALGYPAFGQVLAVGPDVYLYDETDGRVGVIRGRDNRLHDITDVATTAVRGRVEPAPSLAFAGGRLWLVTGPGTVRAIDPAHPNVAPRAVTLTATDPGATRVVATESDAIAVFGSGTETLVARIGSDGTVRRRAPVAGIAPAGVITASADGPRVWIVTASTAVEVDAETLRVLHRVDVQGVVPSGAGAAIGAGGDVWVVARGASELDRIDAVTGHLVKRIPFTARPLHFRQPTDLVATSTDVWLLAPTTANVNRHDARVVRVPIATNRVSLSIEAASELFVGAITVTSH